MSQLRDIFLFLRGRRESYRRVFESSDGKAVLADLAKFCRANTTTFHDDPRAHALAEGRREVWLRIQNHLRLSEDDLWQLLTDGKAVPSEGER